MSRIGRYKKQIEKLEGRIAKYEEKLANVSNQFKSKQISSYSFTNKKEKIASKIKVIQSRIHLLQGAIVKEKHRLEKK